MEIRELTSDADLSAAFELMHSLRPPLDPATFVETVRRQQQAGYKLFAGFVADELRCLAGVREGRTLSRGPHLFVDDLVTAQPHQGKGYGRAMLRRLARYAKSRDLPTIWLDSRATAVGFYEQVGFTMHASVPAKADVESLLS